MQEELFMIKKTIGITAEYNPFHNGHLWQLKTLRKKFGNIPVIACMSGCFVQRGEIALTDPWTRATTAVRSGVDLVLLLPAWYSLHSADYFAAGAVKTLAATGMVSSLVCGAEHTASHTLEETAAWALQSETEQQIKSFLQQGLSYGAAWETAAAENHVDTGWFKGANNQLALAYQKSILRNHLPVKMLILPRKGKSYNDTELTSPYASATAIRTVLRNGHALTSLTSVLPEASATLLNTGDIDFPDLFTRQEEALTLLLSNLLSQHSSQDLFEHCSASRNLCDRFYNARQDLQHGYTSFCLKIANKRDPLPSVRRLALQLLLQRTRDFWTETPAPSYLRVLAFNDRGRSLLKHMKETAVLPIITKAGSEKQYVKTPMYPLLQLDSAAADLFQLLNGNTGMFGMYFTTSPAYIR